MPARIPWELLFVQPLVLGQFAGFLVESSLFFVNTTRSLNRCPRGYIPRSILPAPSPLLFDSPEGIDQSTNAGLTYFLGAIVKRAAPPPLYLARKVLPVSRLLALFLRRSEQ